MKDQEAASPLTLRSSRYSSPKRLIEGGSKRILEARADDEDFPDLLDWSQDNITKDAVPFESQRTNNLFITSLR